MGIFARTSEALIWANAERSAIRANNLSHGADDTLGKPHAVFGRAAVLVGAVV